MGMKFRMGGCGPRGFEFPEGCSRWVRPARRRLGPRLGRLGCRLGRRLGLGQARPPAGVRARRAAPRPAQADRRPAAPRLRPDPRDRGDDPRHLRAEPRRRLSDPDHAPGHGPDRGDQGRGVAQGLRRHRRGQGASRGEGRRGRRPLARLEDWAATSARPAAPRSSARSATCSSALWHRVTRDEVDEQTLHDIAAILDEAAQKIERLKAKRSRDEDEEDSSTDEEED